MERKFLIKEMRDSIGKKEPIEFFQKMTDVFDLLFDKIDSLESQLQKSNEQLILIRVQSALAIQWEPKVAAGMLLKQIEFLRENKDVYGIELKELKKAYSEDRITQNYHDFCKFWDDTLGWHPFLNY